MCGMLRPNITKLAGTAIPGLPYLLIANIQSSGCSIGDI